MTPSRDVVGLPMAIRRPSILVVDDYPSMLDMMTRCLRMSGMDVHSASTGEEAVAVALQTRLTLALIDYHLPGINGVDTAAAIHSSGVRLPWILFSAVRDDRAAFRAGQHGALDVLWSPFDVHAATNRALASLSTECTDTWSSLRLATHLPRPGTAMACAAWWLLRPCASPNDVPTIGHWARFVGVGYSRLRDTYRCIGIDAHDARDFTRMLRALASTGGDTAYVEGQLAVGDPRTMNALIARTGILRRTSDSFLTFEHFLTRQQFIDARHPVITVVRNLALTI